MLSIRRLQVPAYLHASSFYVSLNEEDDEEIAIPRSNMKLDLEVTTTSDLVHMLSTARFWGLDILPDSAMLFALYLSDKETFDQLKEYEDAAKTVACLEAVRFASCQYRIHTAVRFGHFAILRYLLKVDIEPHVRDGVYAAEFNQLACLEVITNKLEGNETEPYKSVALHPLPGRMNSACWKHLLCHGAPLDMESIACGAQNGHLSCLRYMHENVSPIDQRTFDEAVARSHHHCVEFIYENAQITLDVEHALTAVENNDVQMLQFLFEHGCPTDRDVCYRAATSGQLTCLTCAHKHGCPIDFAMMYNTTHLDCIKYMRENGVSWDHRMYDDALKEQRLDLLQYFHDQGLLCSGPIDHTFACRENGDSLRFIYEHGAVVQTDTVRTYILSGNHLIFLKIALQFGYKPAAEDCAIAAESGAVSCLQHLREIGCPWEADTCIRAARAGRLQTLRFAIENGCPVNSRVCAFAAAEFGPYEYLQFLRDTGCYRESKLDGPAVREVIAKNVQRARGWLKSGRYSVESLYYCGIRYSADAARMAVVQYLHEQGCAWDSHACTIAAKVGCVDVLKYLHEHGCPWSAEACNAAASTEYSAKYYSSDSLKCLKYLHENGCPWDLSTANAAADCGAITALKYLFENGCPCDSTTCAAAAGHDSLCCLQYLHEQGVQWDATTCSAAAARQDATNLRYAHEHGCPWDKTTCEAAAFTASLVCLRYAHENGCEWDYATLHKARIRSALNCIAYLFDHGCRPPKPRQRPPPSITSWVQQRLGWVPQPPPVIKLSISTCPRCSKPERVIVLTGMINKGQASNHPQEASLNSPSQDESSVRGRATKRKRLWD